ncbi:MAG: hypothetical protein CME71_03730 [Halobacteriovorax sp.]|nr:hypothetical protein [Halobacteriovorax sp.]|tara:strand:+ start:174 stop:668 length:495 start_codon:yes stop_codon:yes gene_type:complete
MFKITAILITLVMSSVLFAKPSYEIKFSDDWNVKRDSFGADYFAFSPLTIKKESASLFVKEYSASIQEPLSFIVSDINKNMDKNKSKYKNLNIYKKEMTKLGEHNYAVVEYYYFDNAKNMIMFSMISILKKAGSYLYFNYAADEATFNEFKESTIGAMKSVKLQ